MLVNELGGIVDDVVDDQEDVLLGVMLGNVRVCVFCRHFDKRFRRYAADVFSRGLIGSEFSDGRWPAAKEQSVCRDGYRRRLEVVKGENVWL